MPSVACCAAAVTDMKGVIDLRTAVAFSLPLILLDLVSIEGVRTTSLSLRPRRWLGRGPGDHAAQLQFPAISQRNVAAYGRQRDRLQNANPQHRPVVVSRTLPAFARQGTPWTPGVLAGRRQIPSTRGNIDCHSIGGRGWRVYGLPRDPWSSVGFRPPVPRRRQTSCRPGGSGAQRRDRRARSPNTLDDLPSRDWLCVA